MKDMVYVLVTTEFRGVFAGYMHRDADINGPSLKLEQARLAIFWSADVRGFMGLAANGPTEKCRIGPPANIELTRVTSIVTVSDSAKSAWEAGPWGS
jgi:hypothetical protein